MIFAIYRPIKYVRDPREVYSYSDDDRGDEVYSYSDDELVNYIEEENQYEEEYDPEYEALERESEELTRVYEYDDDYELCEHCGEVEGTCRCHLKCDGCGRKNCNCLCKYNSDNFETALSCIHLLFKYNSDIFETDLSCIHLLFN